MASTSLKPIQFVESPVYIKLLSNDKQKFYVNKDVCLVSRHLQNAMSSGFKESYLEDDYK